MLKVADLTDLMEIVIVSSFQIFHSLTLHYDVHRITMMERGDIKMDREIMKGSIDILLLNLLSEKDMYGYEMVKVLKDKSDQLYNMGEGTLYPALKRMEKKQWLHSYWSEVEQGRRKYYQITDEGSAILEKKLEEWNSIHKLITKTSGDLS